MPVEGRTSPFCRPIFDCCPEGFATNFSSSAPGPTFVMFRSLKALLKNDPPVPAPPAPKPAVALNPTEERFCRQNRTFWDEWRRSQPPVVPGRVVVTPITKNVFTIMDVIVPATVLAGVKGATTLFIHKTKRGPDANVRALIESFGPCEFHSLHSLTKEAAAEIERETEELIAPLKAPADVLELESRGVPIGDLVFDNAMRIKPWQASVWEIGERVRTGIQSALTGIRASEKLLGQFDVASLLTSRAHTTYLGSIFRTFMKREVESYLGSFRAVKYPPGCAERAQWSMPASFVQDLLSRRREELLAEAEAFFARQFAEPAPDSGRKNYGSTAEFCAEHGLDPAKPCVFVMLHAFNDYPHCLGKLTHLDYYHWFQDTLETARKNPSVNWIFKQHPAIHFFPCDVEVAALVREDPVPHITFLDQHQHIARASLARIAHAIVTCNGSAALEFSCRGIPGVVAGNSYYTGFGICHECHTLEAWHEKLGTIATLPRLDEEARTMAKVIFYLTNGDLNAAPYSLLPAFSHGERLAATLDELLEHMLKQQPTPEHHAALEALARFIRDERAEQYVDPAVYPCAGPTGG